MLAPQRLATRPGQTSQDEHDHGAATADRAETTGEHEAIRDQRRERLCILAAADGDQ